MILPSILPDLDKILVTDVDVVFMNDISQLYTSFNIEEDCPRKFRDKGRERNFGVAFLKGEQLYGCDEQAKCCDTRLNYVNDKNYIKEEILFALNNLIQLYYAAA